ncbi:MAG: DUF5362 family protein [Firmicutes bacterium]|nr:DUF5362 family protein [Bacillota bacterium]
MDKVGLIDPLNKVTAVLCYIIGILYCLTIIGAIFGIPLIMAGNFYWKCASMNESELLAIREKYLYWSIYSGIVGFPYITACVVVVYIGINEMLSKGTKPSSGTSNATSGSGDDKLTKLEQLADFRRKGLITEEEYQESKNRILNEK